MELITANITTQYAIVIKNIVAYLKYIAQDFHTFPRKTTSHILRKSSIKRQLIVCQKLFEKTFELV